MRVRALFAAVLLLSFIGVPGSAATQPTSQTAAQKSAAFTQPAAQSGPSLAASSAILIDGNDGRVLYEKDATRRRAIASTTKIVTALVVVEKTKPSDVVTASGRAEVIGADDPLVTELELVAGERLTVEQLLYAILLPSANDAAVALAEHVGGSIPKFAEMMNETARKAGATDSNFTNPHGLDDPSHYSTAKDLAVLARALLQNPTLRKIAVTRSYTIPRESSPITSLSNRNQLLGAYEGATGLKTGQTRASGKSLIASASRAGEERIAVLLDSPDTFAEARTILDYGFHGFRRFRIASRGQVWGFATYGDGTTVAVVPTREASILLQSSQSDPDVTFDPKKKQVLATGQDVTLVAPVRFSCSVRCKPRDHDASIVGAIWTVFAPAARAIRN